MNIVNEMTGLADDGARDPDIDEEVGVPAVTIIKTKSSREK
jgi:hypothetical protein